MSKLQAVLFDKRYNNPQFAAQWLAQHQLTPIKALHTTDRYHRARIAAPKGKMRTVNIDKKRRIKGVVMLASNAKRAGSLHIASIRRDKALNRQRGGGFLDTNPAFLENLVTVALTGLAVAGIVGAVKSRKK